MAVNAVRKSVTPGTHQYRTDDLQGEVRKDGKTKRNRDMQAHSQFATNFNFSKRPGDKGSQRANRDDLPKASSHHGSHLQAIGNVRRRDVDLPRVPRRPHGCAP